jgi:hypothetical protein
MSGGGCCDVIAVGRGLRDWRRRLLWRRTVSVTLLVRKVVREGRGCSYEHRHADEVVDSQRGAAARGEQRDGAITRAAGAVAGEWALPLFIRSWQDQLSYIASEFGSRANTKVSPLCDGR